MTALLIVLGLFVAACFLGKMLESPEDRLRKMVAWDVQNITDNFEEDYPGFFSADPKHPPKPGARPVYIPRAHLELYEFMFYDLSQVTLTCVSVEPEQFVLQYGGCTIPVTVV